MGVAIPELLELGDVRHCDHVVVGVWQLHEEVTPTYETGLDLLEPLYGVGDVLQDMAGNYDVEGFARKDIEDVPLFTGNLANVTDVGGILWVPLITIEFMAPHKATKEPTRGGAYFKERAAFRDTLRESM